MERREIVHSGMRKLLWVFHFSLLHVFTPTLAKPSPEKKFPKDYGLFPGRPGKCDTLFF